MLKTREILRLRHELGLSLREIGQVCSCGKTTVSEILIRAKKAEIVWPIDLSDKQLMSRLYPPAETKTSAHEPDMEYTFREMKKKKVTLMLLWEEYKEKHPGGIMYTQFCDRYRKFKKDHKISLHKEHKAGEEVEVDWAGDHISYVKLSTGEVIAASLFVAVLPASAYPFVYAYDNMKMPNWIDAHVRAYTWFGGVPKITIPDNTKTAVIKSDLVAPVLNKSYQEMARHYRTTIMPARAGKPKDKAADENMVGNVSRRIIAALRNRQFFSLNDINVSIKNNLFYKGRSINDAGYFLVSSKDSSKVTFKYNSFIDMPQIVLSLVRLDENNTNTFSASENYWGTQDKNAIESMSPL